MSIHRLYQLSFISFFSSSRWTRQSSKENIYKMDKSASHEGQCVFFSHLGIVLYTFIYCAVTDCIALKPSFSVSTWKFKF